MGYKQAGITEFNEAIATAVSYSRTQNRKMYIHQHQNKKDFRLTYRVTKLKELKPTKEGPFKLIAEVVYKLALYENEKDYTLFVYPV